MAKRSISSWDKYIAAQTKVAKKPMTATVKGGFGATPSLTAEGLLLSTNPITAGGTKKLMLTVQLTKVYTNSTIPDVFATNTPGFTYLHESVKQEQPKGAKSAAPRVPVYDGFRTQLLNVIDVAVYSTSSTGETKANVAALKPGMKVEITGLVARMLTTLRIYRMPQELFMRFFVSG